MTGAPLASASRPGSEDASLASALGIERGDLVTLVGSAGKSTTLAALAREVLDGGGTAVTATTTKYRPRVGAEGEFFYREGREGWPDGAETDRLARVLAERRHLGLAEGRNEAGKWTGLPPECVDRLRRLLAPDLFLVEGDGARQLPLKSHRETEPVIPQSSDVVVQLAPADVLGQPAGPETIHRFELAEARLGLRVGNPLAARDVVRLVLDPAGVLRVLPARARWVVFLNRAAPGRAREDAREIARAIAEILRPGARRPERVVMGEARPGASGTERLQ